MVFFNTKREVEEAREIFKPFEEIFYCFSGEMQQEKREVLMDLFRRKLIRVIFATDVIARGIDVEDVETVIQFRLSSNRDSIVHRSGRTGRKGKEGNNIFLFTDQDYKEFNQFSKTKNLELKFHNSNELGK